MQTKLNAWVWIRVWKASGASVFAVKVAIKAQCKHTVMIITENKANVYNAD